MASLLAKRLGWVQPGVDSTTSGVSLQPNVIFFLFKKRLTYELLALYSTPHQLVGMTVDLMFCWTIANHYEEDKIMKRKFKKALKHVLVHEGGWADHPRDPGGATMKGVSLTTYRRHFDEDRSKDNLWNITDEELEQIYRSGYWGKCRCDELPTGVDYTVFDAAVNSGLGRSARWLQAAVGVKQDGGIGPKTLARVEEHDAIQVADTMCDCRLAFLRNLPT